jgi:hypothetical protein
VVGGDVVVDDGVDVVVVDWLVVVGGDDVALVDAVVGVVLGDDDERTEVDGEAGTAPVDVRFSVVEVDGVDVVVVAGASPPPSVRAPLAGRWATTSGA